MKDVRLVRERLLKQEGEKIERERQIEDDRGHGFIRYPG